MSKFLKIFKEGKDISGKTYTESNAILEQYLQDLNKDLLSSVIILGQGLPNKLSKLSPSGRKERLEKLSKSDFMIEDIKSRLSNRNTKLNEDKRIIEDTSLKVETQLHLYKKQLEENNIKLNEANKENVNIIRNEMVALEQDLPLLKVDAKIMEDNVNHLNNDTEGYVNEISKVTKEMNDELQNETNCFQEAYKPIMENRANIYAQSNALCKEIKKLKAITDICPTCGQKLPNVTKIDTTEKEKQYNELAQQLSGIENKITLMNDKHTQNQKDIKNEYEEKIKKAKDNYQKHLEIVSEASKKLRECNNTINEKEKQYEKDKLIFENHTKTITDLENKKKQLELDVESHSNKLTDYTKQKDDLQQHLDVIKKMDTLVKRYFRGYLLQNVIDYIDMKCKEYSQIVFETDKLDFKLDGNNIAITYDNKPMENLSGGEQQRVDIILQLSIRDMMSKYLNFSSNILVLDEIFDNLDAKATGKILDLISTIQDVNSLFIISHHADELQLDYDSEITVYKNEYGISEVI